MHRAVRFALNVLVATAACLPVFFSGAAIAGAISLVGQLDPNDPQDVLLYPFTLSAPATVSIQTWGYGGTSSAPGGRNAKGTAVAAGGFDPYISVFSGVGPTASFVASNDDGNCPPGALSEGACRDSTLTLGSLPAGTYTLALTAFENMSFAENFGSGTLADGFIGLGSYGGRTNVFAVDISGTAVLVPALTLAYTPNALTFGPQTLNITSGPLTIVVTNTGTGTVVLDALTLAGGDAGDFTVGGSCTGSLAVGASCVISVQVRPTAPGSRATSLVLGSSAAGSPAVINLHATGTSDAVASAALSTTDLDFGDQRVGEGGIPHALVVNNAGGAPLVIGAIGKGGGNPGDFSIGDSCSGNTLAPGASCTLVILFTPGATGPRSATLTFNSNASNNPVTVVLRGGGFIPAIPTLSNEGLVALMLMLFALAAYPRARSARNPSKRKEKP